MIHRSGRGASLRPNRRPEPSSSSGHDRRSYTTRRDAIRRIALDSSTLLTLAWLGILPKVLQAYPEIVLPASVLVEMFEGRARSQKLQKSLVLRAKEIQAAIAKGKIKVHHSADALRDPLSREVGTEFASLLRAAETAEGFVVRPAPLHRLGGNMDEDADVSGLAPVWWRGEDFRSRYLI